MTSYASIVRKNKNTEVEDVKMEPSMSKSVEDKKLFDNTYHELLKNTRTLYDILMRYGYKDHEVIKDYLRDDDLLKMPLGEFYDIAFELMESHLPCTEESIDYIRKRKLYYNPRKHFILKIDPVPANKITIDKSTSHVSVSIPRKIANGSFRFAKIPLQVPKCVAIEHRLSDIVCKLSKFNDLVEDSRFAPFLSQVNNIWDEIIQVEANSFLYHYSEVFKTKTSNFIHALTQCGIDVTMIDNYGPAQAECIYLTCLPNSDVLITRTLGYSMNERRDIGHMIHAARLYNIFKNGIKLEAGDGPDTQLDDTAMIATENVEKHSNTQITNELDISTNVHTEVDDHLQLVSTTEPLMSFSSLTNRMIQLTTTEPRYFSTTDIPNQEIFSLEIPGGIYEALDTSQSVPLHPFTLIKTDVEIHIKVNANQAQCGRYIVAYYPVHTQVPYMNNDVSRMIMDNVYRMLQRDHAVVDIGVSNDVVLTIPFENIRPWLPIQTDEVGETTGANFARISIRCQSPLRISDNGNPIAPFQVFARLVNTKLTGMRYPVALQAGTLDDSLRNVNKAIVSVPVFGSVWKWCASVLGNTTMALAKVFDKNTARVAEVESRLQYIGMINKDRPIDINYPTPLMPQPIHSYSHGRGPYNAKKLRLEPEATTPHVNQHKTIESTQGILDLARIPGQCAVFQINTGTIQGSIIGELPAVPYDPRYLTWPLIVDGLQPPPISFISLMYNFYAGSLVYEFKPVKTTMHNFSIQVAFVPFDGTPGATTESQLQSCTWKTIDFRTSPSGEFTVPWLSTTVMRGWPLAYSGRASKLFQIVNPNLSEDYGAMKDPGKVVVRLVNPLNPTPIASSTIDIIVTVRAHENLRFLSPADPKMQLVSEPSYRFMEYQRVQNDLDVQGSSFPAYLRTATSLNFRMLESGITEVQQGDEQTLDSDAVRQTYGPQIQTLEKHDNANDVMRRFMYHTTLTATRFTNANMTAGSQYPFATLPVTPYSHTPVLNQSVSSETTINFRDMYNSMFRFYRGGMVFVVHSLTQQPLEVTYFPSNDTMYFATGTLNVPREDVTIPSTYVPTVLNPINLGLPTEVIIPQVNPTLTLEIPFYNVNNFIDIQAPLNSLLESQNLLPSKANYPKQDGLALSLGQLFIRQLNENPVVNTETTFDRFKIRITSALADDGQHYHFLGVPPILRTPAMNFDMTQFPTRAARSKKQIQAKLQAEGVESNPGPLMSMFFKSSNEKDDESPQVGFIQSIKDLVRAPSHLTQTATAAFDILEEIKTIIALHIPKVTYVQVAATATAILSALHANTNWYAICSALLSIMVLIGAFTNEAIQSAISKLMMMTPSPEKLESGEMFETNEACVGIFSALLLESIAAYNKVDISNTNTNYEYIKSVFASTFQNLNVFRTGALCIIFTKLCHAIKVLYRNVRSWFVRSHKYQMLENDPEFIKNFMIDYEFVINELNALTIAQLQRHRDRYWTTVITAYYIKAMIAETKDPKYRNSQLNQAVTEVIRKANELNSRMQSPPARYEPYVLWMFGEAGTGKTTLMQSFCVKMLQAIKMEYNGDPIYYRSPHSAFWNGYMGQPVIAIDDANAVKSPEILDRAVSEFQAMKSSAKMRIEKPRLEEKDAEVTSMIVGVCSNVREWQSDSIVDPQAFQRRRDMLIEIEYSDEAKQFFNTHPNQLRVASALPAHMRTENAHLRFVKYDNPVTMVRSMNKLTYKEFESFVVEKFKKYHVIETDRMAERYANSLKLCSAAADRVMDKTTLKAALMSVLMGCETDVEGCVSETHRRTLFEMKERQPDRFKNLPLHTQYMVDKMSAKFEADTGYLCWSPPLNVKSSEYFKSRIAPNLIATDHASTWQIFKRNMDKCVRPWNYEEFLKLCDSELITTECAACRSNISEEVRVGGICVKSTEMNQHWYCKQCYLKRRNDLCPICKSQSLIAVKDKAYSNSLWFKILYLSTLPLRFVLSAAVNIVQTIWNNAFTLALIGTMTSAMSLTFMAAHDIVKHKNLEKTLESNTLTFLDNLGFIPDTYLTKSNGSIIFIKDGQTYEKDQYGVFQERGAILEAGKKKKVLGKDEFHSPISSESEEEKPKPIPTTSVSSDKYNTFNFDLFKPHIKEVDKCENAVIDINKIKIITLSGDGEEIPYEFAVSLEGLDEPVVLPVELCSDKSCSYNELIKNVFSKYVIINIKQWCTIENLKLVDDRPNIIKIVYDIQETRFASVNKCFAKFIQFQKDFLSSLKGKFIYVIEKAYNLFCEKWKWIISAIVLVFALWKGIKWYYSEEDDCVVLEGGSPSYSAGHKSNRMAKTLTMKNPRNVKMQANDTLQMKLSKEIPQNVKSISQLIQQNAIKLQCGNFYIHGFCISNNIALIPRHGVYIMADAQKNSDIVLTQGDMKEILKDNIMLHVIHDEPLSEYVVFQHKRIIGKDIRKHIYDTSNEEVTYPNFAYAVDLRDNDVYPVQVRSVVQSEHEYEYFQIDTTFKIAEEYYSYTANIPDYLTIQGLQGNGKCGSPTVSADGKILAFHVAGEQYGYGTGFSVPLFRYRFENLIAKLESGFENLEYLYTLPRAPYQTRDTQIRPSSIAPKAWESLTFPCIQSKKDKRYIYEDDPLVDGAQSIGRETEKPDPFVLTAATNAVSEYMLARMSTPKMKIPTSIDEAVTACNHEFVAPMNLSTSAGLPYVLTPSSSKSKQILRVDDKVVLDTDFALDYETSYEARKNLVCPRNPFWAHLKDERRKPEKFLKKGGTRVFSVAPLELVLTSRRILLPFMNAFHADPIALCHAIGLAPDSYMWTNMIETLRTKGNKIIQLDFKNFSDSMPWDFVESAFKIIVAYYSKYNLMNQEVSNVITTIFEELTRSHIAINERVFAIKNGVLQGHPLTAIVNSLVNILEQVYVWIKVTNLSGSEFFEYCSIYVMGDDVVMSITPAILSKYNGKSIALEFKKLKIVVTDEYKDPDNIKECNDISTLDFISRSYQLHPYRYLYLAPAGISSIFDTPLWIKRNDGPFLDATLENVEASLMLMFGHGPYMYELYRELLMFLTKHKFRTWFDLDVLFYGEKPLEASYGRIGVWQYKPPEATYGLNLSVTSRYQLPEAVCGLNSTFNQPLEAVAGRFGDANLNTYYSDEFLHECKLDKRKLVSNEYWCNCKYNCYSELISRIKQVEEIAGVPRTKFLSSISRMEEKFTLVGV